LARFRCETTYNILLTEKEESIDIVAISRVMFTSRNHRFKCEMSERYIIPSVDRALRVLTTLEHERRGMALAELGKLTGIPKSSLFRILVTLQHHRCVIWNEEDKAYQLGSRLSELGNSFLEQYDLYQSAGRYMKALADQCQETVFLGKLEEGQVIYLRRMDSPRSATVVKKLGQRVPAHCTATGVAILAFLPEKEVDAILDSHGMVAFNPATITDRTALKRRLGVVRREGFAVVDGEYNEEVICVSAPIFDHTRRPKASLTAAMLAGRLDRSEQVQAVSVMVKEAAARFSADLGYVSRNGTR
jgi:DNA-binding IclR family transcriptional regulator